MSNRTLRRLDFSAGGRGRLASTPQRPIVRQQHIGRKQGVARHVSSNHIGELPSAIGHSVKIIPATIPAIHPPCSMPNKIDEPRKEGQVNCRKLTRSKSESTSFLSRKPRNASSSATGTVITLPIVRNVSQSDVSKRGTAGKPELLAD